MITKISWNDSPIIGYLIALYSAHGDHGELDAAEHASGELQVLEGHRSDRAAAAHGFLNNSCKSSLLQALLLLKQTIESRDVGVPLRTRVGREGYVDLGSVSNLIHHQAQHTQINLTWRTACSVAISDDETNLVLHTLRFLVKVNRTAHVEHLEYSGDEEGKQLLVRLSRQSESAYVLKAQLNGQGLDRLPGGRERPSRCLFSAMASPTRCCAPITRLSRSAS